MATMRRATPEERAECVEQTRELMRRGYRMYKAADEVASRNGWSRNTILGWLREDAPEEAMLLRGGQVPAEVARLVRENAELRAEVRRLRAGQ